MLNEKIVNLLTYLGEDVDDINIIDDERIEINGTEYLVLSDDEADDYFYNYQKELFNDIGIESYSESFRDEILNNYLDEDHFYDMMKESYEFYIEDIRNESAWNIEYESRLEEEMTQSDCETEEDFLEYLMSDYEDKPIQWYIDNFGIEMLNGYVKNNSYLIDIDEVILEVQNRDGRGSLATYDGDELELDDDYYAYRV